MKGLAYTGLYAKEPSGVGFGRVWLGFKVQGSEGSRARTTAQDLGNREGFLGLQGLILPSGVR